jgi:phage terminase large subunit-like protein
LWSVFSSSESAADLTDAIARLDASQLEWLGRDWSLWGREDQLEPGRGEDSGRPPWRTWLILGGRGAGKTRAGAEWIRSLVRRRPSGSRQALEPLRIALVGETMRDARSVMVEGVSGLLAVHGDEDRPIFEAGRQQLVWPSGTIAQLFSAEDPDGLRGPQFHAAWCDELAKWRYVEETWDMLQFGLRLGAMPRQLVTTTPRPIPLLKRLMADGATVTTRVRTEANADNLSPVFIAEMMRRYAGSALGRQELDGEIVEAHAGALWRLDWIERMRVERAPQMIRIVVAVDPPVTATATSDACGIVVAGIGEDRRGYVLADRTIQGRESAAWARAAVAAYRDFEADRIVAEVNQGGDLVTAVIRQIDEDVPLSQVRATRGKAVRAEPVAALYAEGRVAHVGYFHELEQQMLSFGAGGLVGGRSPDRLDALVWALTELMIDAAPLPSIRQL